MALIQVTDGWVPLKMHGSIEVPIGDAIDVEGLVVASLKNLLLDSQSHNYTDIKYRIVSEKIIAGVDGPMMISGDTKTLFFELI